MLINMDEAWPLGEYTYQLTLVPCKLIDDVTHVHKPTCIHTRTVKRAARHAQTSSIYFSLLQCYQLEARLGYVTLQLCRGCVCEVGCH